MALLSPKPAIDILVTGTNHHQDAYGYWIGDGCPDDKLSLSRVADNPHDDNAVAVMYRGRQMGWVGRQWAQTIGPRMDKGTRYKVRVLKHDRNGDPMSKLVVRLEPVDQNEIKPVKPAQRYILAFDGHIGRPDASPQLWRGDCGKFKAGTVLILKTTPTRTSVDLVDTYGQRVGWIRKEEVSGWEEHRLEERWREYLFWVRPQQDMFLMPSERMPDGWRVSALGDGIIHPDVELKKEAPKAAPAATNPNTTKKENTMNNFISRLLDTNKRLATTAAVLEAGRIANNAVTAFLATRMTFLERFINRRHLNSPLSKLLVANGALALAQQARPNDPKVRALTEAMATQAYQEVYQHFDIEGMVHGLLNSPEVKRAMEKLDAGAPKAD